jgi:mRNA interferase MazF
MENEFDRWNEVKKKTQNDNFNFRIKPREIYWAKIGYNIGNEQYGKGKDFVRPLIVVRQLTHDLFIGIPTTTSQKKDNDYFHKIEYRDDLHRDIKSSAMILQQKVFSKKRILSKIGKVDTESFKEIKIKLKRLIDPT